MVVFVINWLLKRNHGKVRIVRSSLIKQNHGKFDFGKITETSQYFLTPNQTKWEYRFHWRSKLVDHDKRGMGNIDSLFFKQLSGRKLNGCPQVLSLRRFTSLAFSGTPTTSDMCRGLSRNSCGCIAGESGRIQILYWTLICFLLLSVAADCPHSWSLSSLSKTFCSRRSGWFGPGKHGPWH